jgi:hypothetical protein
MAVISCPSCKGKLRFPDDSPPRRVKCPSCGNSFMAGPDGPVEGGGTATAPAASKTKEQAATKVSEKASDYDVVDDKPSRKARDDDDDDRPRSKRRGDDEDDEDRPRSKRRDDDDEDDDRGKKRRRDDDDEDDRPRSKRKRDDDDEDDGRDRKRRRGRDDDDDEDDRPRSKRRGRDDEDDDRGKKSKDKEAVAQYRNARQGMGLIGIGFWCQVGAIGIALFFAFLWIIAGENLDELLIPAGLAGLANWILGVIGFSFLLAGPKKGNLLGLTIALVSVAGLHLAMEIYLAFQKDSMSYGRSGSGTIRWDVLPTQLESLTRMLISSVFVTAALIAAILELARFVLFTLVLKEYGRICKDRDVGGSGSMLLIILPSVLGVSLILFLILKMIYKNAGMGSEGKYIYFLMLLIEAGGYIACYCLAALACGKAKDGIVFRKK